MPARKQIPIAELLDLLEKEIPAEQIARLYRTDEANVLRQIEAHQTKAKQDAFQAIEDEIAEQFNAEDEDADVLTFDKILHPNARALLMAYSQGGNLTASVRVARINRQTHYNWLESMDGYAEAFLLAKEMFADSLEAAALMRGREGVLEPVYQNGLQVGTIRRYSDGLLLSLLKAKKPDEYKERVETTHAGRVQYAHSLDTDLSALPVSDLKALREIAGKLVGEQPETGGAVAGCADCRQKPA